MKRCPQCNQEYTDAWISFCSNDGSILVEAPAEPRPNITDRPPITTPQSERPTQWLPRQPPSDQGWIAPDERPPMVPVWQPPPPPAYLGPPSQGLGVASMITALVGIVLGFFCLGPLPAIVAIILGLVALSQNKKYPEKVGGKPFAIAGVVIGGVNVAIYVVILIFIILARLLN